MRAPDRDDSAHCFFFAAQAEIPVHGIFVMKIRQLTLGTCLKTVASIG